jgi:hypothetical protein
MKKNLDLRVEKIEDLWEIVQVDEFGRRKSLAKHYSLTTL